MGSYWSYPNQVPKDLDLSGKVCIITGANTGLGYVCAKEIARRKAHVIMACRSKEKSTEAIRKLKEELSKDGIKEPDLKVEYQELDLNSLASVRKFAEEFKRRKLPLHILMNNAGIMATPFQKTEDGFESQIGVNHLGHFLLTNLLLEELKSSAPSRVVNLSSMAHMMGGLNLDDLMFEKRTYYGFLSYSQSKLCNILFTKELAKRLEGTGVTVNAVHPGFTSTDLMRHVGFAALMPLATMWAKSVENGALTSLWVALAPETEKITGKYWADTVEVEPSAASKNEENQKKLWEISEKLVGLKQ